MLAKLKDKTAYVKDARFNWELRVIKKSRDKQSVKLENWLWYCSIHLELKKESWWIRYKWKTWLSVYERKQKQEVEEKETVDIDLWRVNMELKVWEYETKIRQLNKECESWMIDFNNAKQEKLEFENKYNEVSNKNDSLSKRISLLVELQEQLISKKNFWKTLFLINISIDIIYLLIKYLWI